MRIVKGGSLLDISELKSGDRVKVVSASGEALEVVYQEFAPTTSSVQVRTVDAHYRFITVLDNNGIRKEYEVELNARIIKMGEAVRLEALKTWDTVTMKVGSNGKVYDIQVEERNLVSVSGKVTDLWAHSIPTISIDDLKYNVASYVKITRDGYNITLNDIIIGSRVTVKHTDNIVSVIEIINDRNISLEGTIISSSESNNTIYIQQSNGQTLNLQVANNCIFRDTTYTSSNPTGLNSLRNGWSVMISLYNGKAEEIRIIKK